MHDHVVSLPTGVRDAVVVPSLEVPDDTLDAEGWAPIARVSED